MPRYHKKGLFFLSVRALQEMLFPRSQRLTWYLEVAYLQANQSRPKESAIKLTIIELLTRQNTFIIQLPLEIMSCIKLLYAEGQYAFLSRAFIRFLCCAIFRRTCA